MRVSNFIDWLIKSISFKINLSIDTNLLRMIKSDIDFYRLTMPGWNKLGQFQVDFCLCGNWESFCKTKCMSPFHSFSWKSSHFHVKHFAWALDLKKRQTASLQMSQVAHQSGTYPGFCGWCDLEYFYYPLDKMLVHCRITPNIKFTSTYLYTWVKRGSVGVKCHNKTEC